MKDTNIQAAWGERIVEAVVLHELLHIWEDPHYDYLWAALSKDEKSWDYSLNLREALIESTVRVLLDAEHGLGAWEKST